VDVRDLDCCPLTVFSDQKAEAFGFLLISGDQDVPIFDFVDCFDAEACQYGLGRSTLAFDLFEFFDPKKV